MFVENYYNSLDHNVEGRQENGGVMVLAKADTPLTPKKRQMFADNSISSLDTHQAV